MSAKIRRVDYSIKKYKNPYFKQKKTRIKLRPRDIDWRALFVTFAGFVIVIGLIYLFAYSNFTKITNIEVRGLVNTQFDPVMEIANNGLAGKKWLLLPKNNILIYSKTDLRNNLKQSFNWKSLEIKKILWSRKIQINVVENSPAAIWRENNIDYYVDENGNIVKQTQSNPEASSTYIIIKNDTATSSIENLTVSLDQNWIKKAISIYNEYRVKFYIENISYTNENNAIKINVRNGPSILFSADKDLSYQYNKLNTLMNSQLKKDFYMKNYIDLRYGEAIYIN